jgi:hypothetical protein
MIPFHQFDNGGRCISGGGKVSNSWFLPVNPPIMQRIKVPGGCGKLEANNS